MKISDSKIRENIKKDLEKLGVTEHCQLVNFTEGEIMRSSSCNVKNLIILVNELKSLGLKFKGDAVFSVSRKN
jgi:hypothetical protein